MLAPATMGTGVALVSTPTPRAASQRITPAVLASPNADPPESTTAWHFRTRFPGARTSVSCVAGAAPRTSAAAAVQPSERITVQPVALRLLVQWPTRMPRTSVIASRGPGTRGSGVAHGTRPAVRLVAR